LKIAYISNSLIPSRSANSIHVMKMCQAFAANGHQVELYAKKNEYDLTDEFDFYGIKPLFKIIPIKYTKIRGIGVLLYSIRTKRAVMKNLPDLFFGRNVFSLVMFRKRGIPIVYDSHGFPANPFRKLAESLLFKSKSFKKLMVISDGLKQIYLDEFPSLKEKRIIVAHNATDEPLAIATSTVKIEDNGYSLNAGYVGHLYSGRGIEIIVELARRLSDVGFHIFGGYDDDVADWKSKTSNLKNIYFYGFLKNSDLQSIYPQMDILLAPYQNAVYSGRGLRDSSRWMSPMKIFEYMSFGKAIISSNVTTINEVLKNEYNALLCNPSNVNDWQNAIERIKYDSALRQQISNQAYQDFLKYHTWKIRAAIAVED